MLNIKIRHYAPENIYYLQVQTTSHKQLIKRRKSLEKKLAAESLISKRDELRAMIAEVRREQSYCVDYIQLRAEDVPSNAHVRAIVRKPAKEVIVSPELYQWLLQRLTGETGNSSYYYISE